MYVKMRNKEYRKITDEERAELYEAIADMAMDGKEVSVIASKIDRGPEFVKRVITKLANEGRIDMNVVRAERKKKREKSRGTGIPLTPEHKRDIANGILIMIKKGENTSGNSMGNRFDIAACTAIRLKKAVIAENNITQVQIDLAVSQRKKAVNIFYALKSGKDLDKIVKNNDIDRNTLSRMQELMNKGELMEEDTITIIMEENRRNNIQKMIQGNQKVEVDLVASHIDFVREHYKEGEIHTEDIELLVKAIPMSPELITPQNMNFILQYYTSNQKSAIAIELINECLDALENSDPRKRQTIRGKRSSRRI